MRLENSGRNTLFFVLFFLFFYGISAEAQDYSGGDIPAGHRGPVNSLLCDPDGRILSGGSDGFLNVWDQKMSVALERFQLSQYGIESMILRPEKNEIALVEYDGVGRYRISAWNYIKKEKLFTLPFRGPVDFINYSGAGNFILAGTEQGILLINSDTGAFIPAPMDLAGRITFAATGRSEKTMICYTPPGVLSYWDLETGEEIRRFTVPSGISSPALFGNNRFFAGFDSEGLLVLDAVSGSVIIRENGVREGKIITGNPESTEFVCAETASRSTLYHFNINSSGKLEILARRQLSSLLQNLSAVSVLSADSLAIGTESGGVFVYNQSGSSRLLSAGRQRLIREAAVSSYAMAFITEDFKLGFIPTDYTKLDSNTPIALRDSTPYNSVSSDPAGDPAFLFWQDENSRGFPMVKKLRGTPEDGITEDSYVDSISFRFPLRSVSVRDGNFLFLDSVGNLSVTDQETGEVNFRYVSTGSQDAALMNRDTVMIGRSTGEVPFFTVNMRTGETVPFSLAATVGLKVYCGPSGAAYGAAVNSFENDFITSVFSINMSSPSQSKKIAEYSGEDTGFTMAESGSFLVSSLGYGEAFLYRLWGNGRVKFPAERGPGLPMQILEGGSRFFIIVDEDGNILWHDNRNGRLLAALKISWNEWVLERDGKILRGRISG